MIEELSEVERKKIRKASNERLKGLLRKYGVSEEIIHTLSRGEWMELMAQ